MQIEGVVRPDIEALSALFFYSDRRITCQSQEGVPGVESVTQTTEHTAPPEMRVTTGTTTGSTARTPVSAITEGRLLMLRL